jgi:hypothetical protein
MPTDRVSAEVISISDHLDENRWISNTVNHVIEYGQVKLGLCLGNPESYLQRLSKRNTEIPTSLQIIDADISILSRNNAYAIIKR